MTRHVGLVIFGVALLVRLAGIPSVAGRVAEYPDPRDTVTVYRPIALSLLGGDGYRLAGDAKGATRIAPLFPAYLAGVYGLLGTDVDRRWLAVLSALHRSLTAVLVYWLGRKAFGRTTGALGAILYALDPWEAVWSALPFKETVAVPLSVASVWMASRALDRPSLSRGLGAGLTLGLAALARYFSLGLAAVVLVDVVRRRRAGWLGTRGLLHLGLGVTAGMLLVIGPWIGRNVALFGEPLLSPHFVGRYLYTANAPGNEAHAPSGYSEAPLAPGELLRQVERSGDPHAAGEWTLLRAAAEHLASQPQVLPRLVWFKLVNMWRPTYAGASVLNWWVLGLPYCGFLALALVGMWPGSRRPRGSLLGITLGFYVLAHLVFTGEIRHRQYLTPFLAPFAGRALTVLLGLRGVSGQ